MSISRIALTALVTAALLVSACGLKGDPIRPGSAQDIKNKQQQKDQQEDGDEPQQRLSSHAEQRCDQ